MADNPRPSYSKVALITAINTAMPFGKYQGQKLLSLPEPYLVWFHQPGFPEGKLGEQLALMYEIKRNGLESILNLDSAANRAMSFKTAEINRVYGYEVLIH